MPIYEYRCQACGHQMEAIQKMSDPQLSECPQCHEQKLTKLMSAGSFQMKSSHAAPFCPATGVQPTCGGGVCPACE